MNILYVLGGILVSRDIGSSALITIANHRSNTTTRSNLRGGVSSSSSSSSTRLDTSNLRDDLSVDTFSFCSSIVDLTADDMSIMSEEEEEVSYPLTNISEPTNNDCLFGRGLFTYHHPGNKHYRQIVDSQKTRYSQSKKFDKRLVAVEIVTNWRNQYPPGRFLQLDDTTNLWNDVGDKKAIAKTSQALREKKKTPVKQRDVNEEVGVSSAKTDETIDMDLSVSSDEAHSDSSCVESDTDEETGGDESEDDTPPFFIDIISLKLRRRRPRKFDKSECSVVGCTANALLRKKKCARHEFPCSVEGCTKLGHIVVSDGTARYCSGHAKTLSPDEYARYRHMRNRQRRERYRTDPNFRIADCLHSRLNKALKAQGTSYQGKLKLLGCSVDQFKRYLALFFSEPGNRWMNWKNHGRRGDGIRCWEIDHIYPLSKLDLTDPEQLRRAQHWSNFQPLSAADNGPGGKFTDVPIGFEWNGDRWMWSEASGRNNYGLP